MNSTLVAPMALRRLAAALLIAAAGALAADIKKTVSGIHPQGRGVLGRSLP